MRHGILSDMKRSCNAFKGQFLPVVFTAVSKYAFFGVGIPSSVFNKCQTAQYLCQQN